jgi:hypothetical protein
MARYPFWALLLILAVPAFARSHQSKPPIPCSDVWNAVTVTLADSSNYTLIATDSSQLKAVFSVFGARYPQINSVRLKPRNGSCELQIRMGFTGCDDEWAFRRRVNRSLSKLEAAKPTAPPKSRSAE